MDLFIRLNDDRVICLQPDLGYSRTYNSGAHSPANCDPATDTPTGSHNGHSGSCSRSGSYDRSDRTIRDGWNACCNRGPNRRDCRRERQLPRQTSGSIFLVDRSR
jgi:hypothetical protein